MATTRTANSVFKSKAATLETAFFLVEEGRLRDRHEMLKKMIETRDTLSQVSGITNPAVLDKLVALGIKPDTLASLSILPLVEVAWADGEVDEKERAALVGSLEKAGFIKDLNREIFEVWLTRRPEPSMKKAWKVFVKGLCEIFTPEEKAAFKAEIMEHCRQVAKSSGGFLGIASISDEERMMIEQLEKAFE